MSVMLFLLYSGQEPSEHLKNSYKSSYENNEHYFRINHNSVHLVGYTDTLYENIFLSSVKIVKVSTCLSIYSKYILIIINHCGYGK